MPRKTNSKVEELTTLHVKNIPVNVMRDYKAACGRMGVTMQNCIVKMMREFAHRQLKAETGRSH